MAAVPPLTQEEQIELRALRSDQLEYQRFLQDKFSLYREGDSDYRKSQDDIRKDFEAGNGDRYLALMRRQVPRRNYTAQLNENQQDEQAALASITRERYRRRESGGGGPGANKTDAQRQVVRDEFQRATAMMTVKKNFTFIKILGAGGNGMVVLWKWTPSGNPLETGHFVVMKMAIDRDDDGEVRSGGIRAEKRHMFRLLRAPHITQMFIFNHKLPPQTRRPRSIEQHRIAFNLSTAKGLLFMEYARLGDLHRAMKKLAGGHNGLGRDDRRRNRHLPPEALWLIFDCLVKGCMAMEYPPRYVTAGAPFPQDGDFLPEVIPPGGQAAPVNGFRGIVHFDLDPQNIFLRGYDPRRGNNQLNPPHRQVPRFQIADLGLANVSSVLWDPVITPDTNELEQESRRVDMWEQREFAKHTWFLPEQFTGEWDLLDRDPEEGPRNAPPGSWPAWSRWPITSGPGRYSHRSNIWHVGLTMFCLLLLQHPDWPAVAGRMKSEEPAVVPPATDVPIEDQRWTYGYRLIEDDDAGREYRYTFSQALCETVAKCLMARQEHRPDLNQLQADITNALGNPLPALHRRVRRFFGNDVPPPMPWRNGYTDVDLLHMDPFDPYPDDSEGEQADPPTPRPRGRKRRKTRHAPLEDLNYRP